MAKFKKLKTYLGRLVPWAKQLVKICAQPIIAILTLLIILAAIQPLYLNFGRLEMWIRFAGMVLQLLGFTLAAWQLRSSAELFETKTLFAKFKAHWKKKPKFNPRVVEIKGGAFASQNTFGSGTIYVNAKEGSSTEHRLKALEGNFAVLRKSHQDLQTTVNEKFTKAQNKHISLEASLNETKKQLDDKLTSAVADGLHLEWTALVFFIVGVVLATASPEISAWIEARIFSR